MPVQARKNQYNGINAHLHSEFQAVGGWHLLHNAHITHLVEALVDPLLGMGYSIDQEEGLQVRRLDIDLTENPRSDLLVLDLDPKRAREGGGTARDPGPAAYISGFDMLVAAPPPSERKYTALAIYEFDTLRHTQGEPVAWIELLSPSNKRSGDDYWQYVEKRQHLIDSGLVFIELDYLNEGRATIHALPPPYKDNTYRITLIDPRMGRDAPDSVTVWPFATDQSIPTVTLPLNRDDTILLPLQTVYNDTIRRMALALKRVDYAELPAHFDRYTKADQARIGARMLTVCAAARSGVDLEAAAPLPVDAALTERLFAAPDVAEAVSAEIVSK